MPPPGPMPGLMPPIWARAAGVKARALMVETAPAVSTREIAGRDRVRETRDRVLTLWLRGASLKQAGTRAGTMTGPSKGCKARTARRRWRTGGGRRHDDRGRRREALRRSGAPRRP